MVPNRKQIKLIIDQNPSTFYWKIKSKYPDFFESVKNRSTGESFSEKLYLELNEKGQRFCNIKGCSGICEFQTINHGYDNFCSKNCSSEHWSNSRSRTQKSLVCEKEFELRECENQKLCSIECRNEWLSKEEVVKKRVEKAEETLNEKYGDSTFRNVEKIKKTKKDRYGDSNYNNLEKMKATKEKRHGDPFYANLKEMRRKNKEKYGNRQISKTEYYSSKREKTDFKKFFNKLVNLDRLSDKVEPLFSLDEYEGVRYYKEYEFKCLECNAKFEDHLMSGHVPRCPSCYPIKDYSSKAEKEIFEYVSKLLDVEVQRNVENVLEQKELDIFVLEKNLAIEFNGLYWHSENAGDKSKEYHLQKTNQCEEKEIHLVHIFEDEWIDKQNIVKNRLKHLLDKNHQRLCGRDCSLKEVTTKKKNEFLNQHHLQGPVSDKVCYGLYYQNDLVSLMSFGKTRYDNGWEIYRFCNSNVSVVGGASKLLHKFTEDYNPDRIVSYADRRWSMKGNTFYNKIGFEFENATDPNYWYMKDYREREYRFKYRKSQLENILEEFDSSLTEWENMQMNGYDRIWDCGNLKFVWRK